MIGERKVWLTHEPTFGMGSTTHGGGLDGSQSSGTVVVLPGISDIVTGFLDEYRIYTNTHRSCSTVKIRLAGQPCTCLRDTSLNVLKL